MDRYPPRRDTVESFALSTLRPFGPTLVSTPASANAYAGFSARSSLKAVAPQHASAPPRFQPIGLRPDPSAHNVPVRIEAGFPACRRTPRRLAESEAEPMRADERRHQPERADKAPLGAVLTSVGS